jgi:NitT/TauT family transport system permease protein
MSSRAAEIKGGRTARPGPRAGFSRRFKSIVTVINLVLFCVALEVIPTVFEIPRLFLPKLSEIVAEIAELHEQGILLENLLISLRVYLVGMLASILIGVPGGLLLGAFRSLDRFISPYVWVIYTTPLIILMPLILLWVGINNTARVLLIVVSAVPAILVVVMEGVKTVDNSLLKAAKSFGADRRRLFTHVIFPSTVPFIATGVKMGISRGLIGLFVGELFTAADGIGFVITLATKVFNTARVYAMLLIFVVFSVVMVGVGQMVERRLSAWRSSAI